MDDSDLDYKTVAGDAEPELFELLVGEVGALDQDMEVRVPPLPVDGPVDFEEGDAAGNAFLPEFCSAEFLEGGVEFVEQEGERFSVGFHGEGEEAEGTLLYDVDDI